MCVGLLNIIQINMVYSTNKKKIWNFRNEREVSQTDSEFCMKIPSHSL